MLPPRTIVITAIACGIGVAAGALTYMASHSPVQALLATGTATDRSVDLLRQLMSAEPEGPGSGCHNDPNDSQDDDPVVSPLVV